MPRLVIHCAEFPSGIADCDVMVKTIRAYLTNKAKLAARDRLDDIQAGSPEIFQGLAPDRLFMDSIDRS